MPVTGDEDGTGGVTDVGQGDIGAGAMCPSATRQQNCVSVPPGDRDSPLRPWMDPEKRGGGSRAETPRCPAPWPLLGAADTGLPAQTRGQGRGTAEDALVCTAHAASLEGMRDSSKGLDGPLTGVRSPDQLLPEFVSSGLQGHALRGCRGSRPHNRGGARAARSLCPPQGPPDPVPAPPPASADLSPGEPAAASA